MVQHRFANPRCRPNELFNPEDLSQAQKGALEKRFLTGKEVVKSATRNGLINMNGWMLSKDMGRYGTDYLVRAVVADATWGGPSLSLIPARSASWILRESNSTGNTGIP
jgi:hypothetical protein